MLLESCNTKIIIWEERPLVMHEGLITKANKYNAEWNPNLGETNEQVNGPRLVEYKVQISI